MPVVKNILFLCGKNRFRSPTAEHVFAGWPGIETSSAGVNSDADVPVTGEMLEWADLVFVMEPAHRSKLSAKFKHHLGKARIVCLDIPDDFEYMDPRLIQLLQSKVPAYLPPA